MPTGVEPQGAYTFDNVVCPCNTWGDFTQPCGIHGHRNWQLVPYVPEPVQTYMLTWPPPVPQRLSDEDVDRIARRVVELQREERTRADHDPGDEC